MVRPSKRIFWLKLCSLQLGRASADVDGYCAGMAPKSMAGKRARKLATHESAKEAESPSKKQAFGSKSGGGARRSDAKGKSPPDGMCALCGSALLDT